ncbi:MAG: ATP-binding protein, partial [Armatimonadetes bacterium]|nr:ATP-binding protein [Armatimonadota bacterium]
MILRKVTLSNWRALTKFEMRLEDGLNVLQGRNEAGKSSVVEAIDWALFRDITGARLRAEDVRVLIPASEPSARPSVEIELEFPDCRAVLLKI